MKYEDNLVFWSDISIVALESFMSLKGDIHSIQYQNVRNATEDIIKFMVHQGLTKEVMQSSVSQFLKVRDDFVNSEMSSSAPPEFIPATLVAMCVRTNANEEITDEEFVNLVSEAFSYLSNYAFK